MEENTDAVINGTMNFIKKNGRIISLVILGLIGINIILNTILNYENFKNNYDITGLANPYFIITNIVMVVLVTISGIVILQRRNTGVLKIITIISAIYLVFSCIFYFKIYLYKNKRAKEISTQISEKVETSLEKKTKKSSNKKQTYDIYESTPM